MVSSVEQANGNGMSKSVTFVLVMVTMLCVCLIGAAGYVKFQLDQTEYTLSEVADAQATASSEPVQITPQQAELTKQRQVAKRDMRSWSLVLTFIAWASVIVAAGLTVSVYIILQRRQSPALRALAQSVANLARGDMQTPIWGMERSDSIGELARAVDLARYHFSQMPDMSIMSEQGPVRIKFEGGAKSLFEAMMQQITTQTARIGDEATDLASAAANQHKMMTELPLRLNAALEQLQRNDRANNQIIQRVSHGMEKAFEQLEQLVPFMQKRAQGMAEVTQIAGSQVASSLKTLTDSERMMRDSTVKNQQTVDQLTSSTKDLGERLFAALNIVQASGKVLNETTENTQSHLKELVDNLNTGGSKLMMAAVRIDKRLEASAKAEETLTALTNRTEEGSVRMDKVITSMEERHDKLSEQITTATERLNAIIGSFTGAQVAMSDALKNISRDGGMLNSMFLELKGNNEQVLERLSRTANTSHEVVQHLADSSQKMLQQMQDKLVNQTQVAQDQLMEIAQRNNELSEKTDTASQAISSTVEALENAKGQFDSIRDSFANTLNDLGGRIEGQAADIFGKTEQIAAQNYDKLSTLTEAVDQALQRLNVLGQLTGTLGAVAGQLGQIIPVIGNATGVKVVEQEPSAPAIDISALSEKLLAELDERWRASANQIDAVRNDIASMIDQQKNHPEASAIPEKFMADFEERWHSTVNQIDSVRDDLASMIDQQKGHLEMRLLILDKQIRALPDSIETDPKQIALLQDIITTLESMNHYLTRLDPDYSETANNGEIIAV